MTGKRVPLVPWCAAAAAALAIAATPAVAASASSQLPMRRVLPIAVAMDGARAAMASCAAQGYAVAVAVVDRDGEVKLLAADPDVNSISIELSQRKARTAALFQARSADIGARFQANPGFAQAMNGVDPRLSGAQGAVPIIAAGEVLGAMGISGAPGGDRDEACVTAGLVAMESALQ